MENAVVTLPSISPLFGLALSDVAVGFVVEPLFVAVELLKFHGYPKGEDSTLEKVYSIVSYIVCGVPISHVTFTNMDRLLATTCFLTHFFELGFKYPFFDCTALASAGIFLPGNNFDHSFP